MTAVAAPAPSQPRQTSTQLGVGARPCDLPTSWTVKRVHAHSLRRNPGPSGVAQRIALWLDEWSLRSFSHDSHHWSAKSEVLRGLKNIGQQVGR